MVKKILYLFIFYSPLVKAQSTEEIKIFHSDSITSIDTIRASIRLNISGGAYSITQSQSINTNSIIVSFDICKPLIGLGIYMYSLQEVFINPLPAGKYFLIVKNNPFAGEVSDPCSQIGISNSTQMEFEIKPAIEPDPNNYFEFLDFYPNPTSGKINYAFLKKLESIHVFNVLGDIIYSEHPYQMKGSFDLSEISTGIYFIQINSNGKTKTLKFIKQ